MKKKLKKLPKFFKEILKEASLLADSSGVRIYLVGGVVRDLLLEREVFDLDIVVEGDAIEFAKKMAEVFKVEFRKHHVFATAVVYFGKHKIDFATARSEHYAHWGALPKVTPAKLKEDLLRRDFTINAMAVSLNKEDYATLVDYSSGEEDLKKGVIRILHKKSFLEDPTRILRAIRFEQRFRLHLEPLTMRLLSQALSCGALNFVHPHRMRDELVLILKENRPFHYIKRIEHLCGFKFIEKGIKLDSSDYKLFKRIANAIVWHKKHFVKSQPELETWVLYLAVFLIKLPEIKILDFFHGFALRKSDRVRILSIKIGLTQFFRLNHKLKPHQIYKIMHQFSLEAIMFFYAYYKDKRVRKNIGYYLTTLTHIHLKIKGQDFKKLGLKPYNLYSKVLEEVLWQKMDKGFVTKVQELASAKKIFNRCEIL